MKNKIDLFFSENDKRSKFYQTNKIILENVINQNLNIKIDEETTTNNLYFASNNYDNSGNFDLLSLDLSKRTFNKIRIKDLVGVQPMMGPVGVYYALRFIADDTYSGVPSGQEIGYNKIDSSYSETTSISAGESLGSKDGVGVGDEIGLGIGSGTHIKEISMSIEKDQVEAKTRKLKSRISEEVLTDVFNMHNIVLKNEILNTLAEEIASEIDMEFIEKMESVSVSSSLDYTTISAGMGTNRSDINNSFITYVIDKCNEIGVSTNHGVGNFIIASPNISTILESTSTFISSNNEDIKNGLSFAGYLNGKKLYRNIFWTTDKFLVGYKGSTELDAGLFYLPYIQTFLNGVYQDSFQKYYGIISRYGIGENIFGSSNYYRKVDVTNFSI